MALAAGIALPYGCRAGRCASCKSRLISGDIEYPAGTPPGITAAEIARGEVLLCQARPRSDLVVETRALGGSSGAVAAELTALEGAALGALRLRLTLVSRGLKLRPGQYVEVRNAAGDAERLPVIAISADGLDVESADDGGTLHQWLTAHARIGSRLLVAGPFESLR